MYMHTYIHIYTYFMSKIHYISTPVRSFLSIHWHITKTKESGKKLLCFWYYVCFFLTLKFQIPQIYNYIIIISS